MLKIINDLNCVMLGLIKYGLLVHSLTLSQTTNFRLFQTERVCR